MRDRDAAIAALAARQYGVVGTAQLAALGLSTGSIGARVAAGRLHRLHAGVYAVGHTVLMREGRWMAAVLACGPGAALSHRDGAALWTVRPTSRTRIDVSAPRSRAPRPGIDVHRVRHLDPADVTVRAGIAVTTLARTLVDLASVLSEPELRRAVRQAEFLRRLDGSAVMGAIGRANGRPGLAALRRALALEEEPFTRSSLERRFLALCRQARLALPQANVWVPIHDGGYEVDFLWPDQRLVVETDGAAAHATRRAFEDDRVRDADLTLAGYTVVRFTWRRIAGEPDAVAHVLRRLLDARQPPATWTSVAPYRTRRPAPAAHRARGASPNSSAISS